METVIACEFSMEMSLFVLAFSDSIRVYRLAPKFVKVADKYLNGTYYAKFLKLNSMDTLCTLGEAEPADLDIWHLSDSGDLTLRRTKTFLTKPFAVKTDGSHIYIVGFNEIIKLSLDWNDEIFRAVTYDDYDGVCAVSVKGLVAYPETFRGNTIRIYDSCKGNEDYVPLDTKDKGRIQMIEFNPDGEFLAVANSNGTTIRVYEVSSGDALIVLARGIHSADISSLVFSPLSNFLAVSTNLSTVHIFKLGEYDNVKMTTVIVSTESRFTKSAYMLCGDMLRSSKATYKVQPIKCPGYPTYCALDLSDSSDLRLYTYGSNNFSVYELKGEEMHPI